MQMQNAYPASPMHHEMVARHFSSLGERIDKKCIVSLFKCILIV
jgi:bifunctional DNase/RNase